MRTLYTLAWWLLLPLVFLHLLWRARRQPEYLRHWGERLGAAPRLGHRPVIWLHAVSVGETRAAAPLVSALRAAYPGYTLLITHTTPTGRATGAELFGDTVVQAYLPYDLPWCLRRFLDRAGPRLCILMETEVWPNLIQVCHRRAIPVCLVNARLSARSARGYARLGRLARQALAGLALVAAQTEADAARLRALGAREVVVTGNLKFDVTPPADTAQRAAELRALFSARFVWLAASTREGEEALLLDALDRLDLPGLLLVIVPRHPQRFDAVAQTIAARGLSFARRSEHRPVAAAERVFLGDSLGELAAYYRAADLAFVGGSLLPHGGHNLIEAAAAGVPVLIGPHTWNFAQAAQAAVASGAAIRVHDVQALAAQVRRLYIDAGARRAMAAAGLAFARAHQGATQRVMDQLARLCGGQG
ncbi:MAG: lipid IV(A) 3-deoxy-D-manno-octulosonic acid transferase [Thiobacillaceae bacterium]|nr:lipid IV(A) 3-deoxy-D-manno-octulosonic acid transferase [Thiobacillaceae bacterium]